MRYLHTMVRVTDVEQSLHFYRDLLGLKEVRRIELARDRYKNDKGMLPVSVELLAQAGYLTPAPSDPYGGLFYFELDGKVATTSKFAFGGVKKGPKHNNGELYERH